MDKKESPINVGFPVGNLSKFQMFVNIAHSLRMCSQQNGRREINSIHIDGCSHDLAYPCYFWHRSPDSNSNLKLTVLTNIDGPVIINRTFTEEEEMKIDISPCHRPWSKLFGLLSNEHGPLTRGYMSGINHRGQLESFLPYLASRNNITHSNR